MKKIVSLFFSDIKQVPEVVQNSHFASLDGLRAVSILIVLLSHLNSHLHNRVLGLLVGNGAVGVYVFFVLSGFLITTLILKEKIKSGNISLKNFYTRRLLRIFPLAYLYIIVIFLLNFVFDLNIPASAYIVAGLYLVNLFQFFSVPYYFNHYWSLSAEEQFYILIPPIIKMNFKLYRYLAVFLLGLTFVSRFIFEKFPTSFSSKLLFDLTRNMDGLLVGSIFSILMFTNLIPWHFLKKYRTALNLILFPLILILNNEPSSAILRLFFNHTFYSIIIGVVIINNITPSGDVIFKMLNSKLFRQIGVMSYSIYIWQQLFTSDLLSVYYPFNIIAIFVVSFISYYGYERYFLKLKDRFKSAAKSDKQVEVADSDKESEVPALIN